MSTMKKGRGSLEKNRVQRCLDHDDTGAYCSGNSGGLSDTSYILAESP